MPTFPKDDSGNVRVDFVYGNVPLQPNEGRDGNITQIIYANGEGNRSWSGSETFDSSNLPVTTFAYLSKGDQSYDAGTTPDTRTVVVPTIHDIATEGYGNFPQYVPNYQGNGDDQLDITVPDLSLIPYSSWQSTLDGLGLTWANNGDYTGATLANKDKLISQEPAAGSVVGTGSEVVTFRYVRPLVPNVVDFDSLEAAQAFLQGRGLTLGASSSSSVGATTQNDGWIKSQSIAPNTEVDGGTAVDLVTYHYVLQPPVNPPATTGPIAGFKVNSTGTSFSMSGDRSIMFLTGRTVKPTVGDVISVVNTTNDAIYARNWNVLAVENNDSYNTGGTAVLLSTATPEAFYGADALSGTWTKI